MVSALDLTGLEGAGAVWRGWSSATCGEGGVREEEGGRERDRPGAGCLQSAGLSCWRGGEGRPAVGGLGTDRVVLIVTLWKEESWEPVSCRKSFREIAVPIIRVSGGLGR